MYIYIYYISICTTYYWYIYIHVHIYIYHTFIYIYISYIHIYIYIYTCCIIIHTHICYYNSVTIWLIFPPLWLAHPSKVLGTPSRHHGWKIVSHGHPHRWGDGESLAQRYLFLGERGTMEWSCGRAAVRLNIHWEKSWKFSKIQPPTARVLVWSLCRALFDHTAAASQNLEPEGFSFGFQVLTPWTTG